MLCTTRAHQANLTGTYLAWLSTDATGAVDRFAGARGWVRTDGRPLADLPGELLGALRYPIRFDENGHDVGEMSTYVATATFSDGSPLDTCNDFSQTTGLVNAGLPWAAGAEWTADNQLSCGAALRLYCFGVDLDVPLVITPAVGRTAFVSTTKFDPSTGLAMADAACTTDAAAAGLTGSFEALIPAAGASAASRFDTAGAPWVRVDGIPLADTAADFFNGNEVAPLNVTASGKFVGVEPITGLNTPLDVPSAGDDCNDWTNTTGGDVLGLASESGSGLFFYTTAGCATASPVYCLEM